MYIHSQITAPKPNTSSIIITSSWSASECGDQTDTIGEIVNEKNDFAAHTYT